MSGISSLISAINPAGMVGSALTYKGTKYKADKEAESKKSSGTQSV